MDTSKPPVGLPNEPFRAPVALGETFQVKVEDGVYYGVLTVGDTEFREALDERVPHLEINKQIYWMRRCIEKLRSRSKKMKAMERHKVERKLRIGHSVMQEKLQADQLEAMGVERKEEKPADWTPTVFNIDRADGPDKNVSGYHHPDGTFTPEQEGNEVQNG